MKTETKKAIKKKKFDTVGTFRKIKEKISDDISDMSPEQITEYLKIKKVRLKD